MFNAPDHPIIRQLEKYGVLEEYADDAPKCPICGKECSVIYTNNINLIVGCDWCIQEHEAWELPKEFFNNF